MEATVKITLEQTIKAAKTSRNGIAVEGKIRPATINELCKGESKAISFETLRKIVDALNTLDTSGKQHTIEDVMTIEYK
ncbi:helix-turn-helix domain-containing protein [Sporosarcina sp. A2]|uniref:helix-turn-helix domain-containing protein n=1 Tax=Sporosarcina sp. A2 TaxID=3393449 RepID=UPI003D7A3450